MSRLKLLEAAREFLAAPMSGARANALRELVELEEAAMVAQMGDAEELLATGLLFELNRRVLHPMGLALAVDVRGGRAERISPRLLRTDDPEGLVFSDEDLEDGYARLTSFMKGGGGYRRLAARYEALGFRGQVPADVDPSSDPEADWGPFRLRVSALLARVLLSTARVLEAARFVWPDLELELENATPGLEDLLRLMRDLQDELRAVAAVEDLEVRV